MKKLILLIFSLIIFFTVAQTVLANTGPTELLRDLLKILFSFQSVDIPPTTPFPTPEVSPDTTPGVTPPDVPPAGDVNKFFPNPLNPISDNITSYTRSQVMTCLSKIDMYEQASTYHGVPWQILAAIHYLEDNCGSGSLVSGRAIGAIEPDLKGECSSGIDGPGIPVPVGVDQYGDPGCGFRTLLDSAIYAGKHLQSKIGKNPSDYQDLVMAFGRYNGLGNQNCGVTPYSNCPRLFESEDHIYPLNWFDKPRHNVMYLVYCADHVKCNPPVVFQRPGALTVLRILSGK